MAANEEGVQDKPAILKAVEVILANPADIQQEAEKLLAQFEQSYRDNKTPEQIRRLAAKRIVSNYSNLAAFVGGTTALSSIIPGLGTAVAISGGALTDAIVSMKFQIEMTMAIACVYGRDLQVEEERRLCFLLAGLGAVSEAAKEGGKQIGTKAFVRMTNEYLKGATLVAVKEIFKKVGITFTRSAVQKAIPFGVGVIIGASANKGLTSLVGSRVIAFFTVEPGDQQHLEVITKA